MLDSCLPHYLLSSNSKAMTLHKVSSLHTSFFKIFNKKKLNFWCLMLVGQHPMKSVSSVYPCLSKFSQDWIMSFFWYSTWWYWPWYLATDTVFLTHVGIGQMSPWLLMWKATSLYHVGTFLLTWFFCHFKSSKLSK